MTLLTSSILALEPLFDGMVSYFAPNWLLNPESGLLRSLSYISRTALKSGHLDSTNRIPIMATGAWYLGMAVMQMLAKNVLQKRAFLKTKLFNAALLSIVFLRAAFTKDSNSMLSPAMTGLKAGLQIGNILWVISDMIRYFSATKDNAHRTPLKGSQLMFLAFHLVHAITSAISMMSCPEQFVGGEGWGFWRKMSPEQNEIDQITKFASQIGGAFFLTSAYIIFDILVFDRSVERFAWWNTQAVITYALHSLMFLRASMDGGYKWMSIFNALLVVWSMKIGPTLLGEIKNSIMHEEKKTRTGKTDGLPVPGLSDEIHTKKAL